MSIVYENRLPQEAEFSVLFESTGWNQEYHLSSRELFAAISESWQVVSAYDGSRLVGFGRVVSDGVLHAMIYDLIVDQADQGKGIGGEILARLVMSCQKAGIRDIQLFCAKGRQAFYERRGFRPRSADAPGMEYAEAARKPNNTLNSQSIGRT